jgi:hypothetical protein
MNKTTKDGTDIDTGDGDSADCFLVCGLYIVNAYEAQKEGGIGRRIF